MTMIVKHTPIKLGKRTYGVGEKFPYSDKDISLLDKGYLTEVKEETPKAKDGPTKNVGTQKVVQKKKATAPKKAVAKKTNSKKK